MKALETKYNGFKFRSRLEARWAVFFDALRIKYLYEVEGFDLGNNIWYLPDFYLPQYRYFIEVKYDHDLYDKEKLKLNLFADQLEGQKLYVLLGDSYLDSYRILERVAGTTGLTDLHKEWLYCPLCKRYDINSYKGKVQPNMEGLICNYCSVINRNWNETIYTYYDNGIVVTKRLGTIRINSEIMRAYAKARSARF